MQLHIFSSSAYCCLLTINHTPIFALATSTSFSHSSGVFNRRERACRPILSNSSFNRVFTIRWRWIAVLEAKAGETIATAKSGYQLLHPDYTLFAPWPLPIWAYPLCNLTRQSSPGAEQTWLTSLTSTTPDRSHCGMVSMFGTIIWYTD